MTKHTNGVDRRRAELRRMMRAHDWNASDVANLVLRQPQTVRAWLCGTRNMPENAMRLLKLAADRPS